jgi:hypothetical protein
MLSLTISQATETICSPTIVLVVYIGVQRILVEAVHGIRKVTLTRTGRLLDSDQVWNRHQYPTDHWISIVQGH